MEWCLSISTSKYMDMIVRIKHRKSEQAFFHVKPITTIPILCIYFSRPSWIETWPSLGTTSEKKSKKWDIGPISLDLYPPTINRDIFDFIFPPTLLMEIGTILKKNFVSKHISRKFKRDKNWSNTLLPLTLNVRRLSKSFFIGVLKLI